MDFIKTDRRILMGGAVRISTVLLDGDGRGVACAIFEVPPSTVL